MANTRRVWEPRYGHALSDTEIVEMLLGVGRLFDVLTSPNAGETTGDLSDLSFAAALCANEIDLNKPNLDAEERQVMSLIDGRRVG